LLKAKKHFTDKEVQFLVLTRFHDTDQPRPTEKARADSSWKALLTEAGPVPMVMSTASMERYGGSSTPTFVFVDRKGSCAATRRRDSPRTRSPARSRGS